MRTDLPGPSPSLKMEMRDMGAKRRGGALCLIPWPAPHRHRQDTISTVQIFGIDVGGSGIKGAPVDIRTGRLAAERLRIPTPKGARPKAVAAVVASMLDHFGWQGPVGCGIPARVKQGVARTAANISDDWIGTDAARLFSKASKRPFAVLNDADAAALAEMHFGAGRGLQGVVLMLTLGTGIGSALFVDNALVPNTEFGHFWLRGQVAERYASDRARKEENLDWKTWAARMQEYLTHLERLLDIDAIILGGGVSKPSRSEKFLHLLDTKAQLLTAELRNEAGIVGAALTAGRLIADQ